MDRPSNRRDHPEKKSMQQENQIQRDGKKVLSTACLLTNLAQRARQKQLGERTSDSRDRPAYRDGRLLLAQQRQLASQNDRYGTHELSASLKNLRLGSYGKREPNARKSNTGELGVPKGGGEDESTSQQQRGVTTERKAAMTLLEFQQQFKKRGEGRGRGSRAAAEDAGSQDAATNPAR